MRLSGKRYDENSHDELLSNGGNGILFSALPVQARLFRPACSGPRVRTRLFNRGDSAVEQVLPFIGSARQLNKKNRELDTDELSTGWSIHSIAHPSEEVNQMKTLRQWNALRSQRKGGVRPAGKYFKWAA